jgi:hypothetical protein
MYRYLGRRPLAIGQASDMPQEMSTTLADLAER